MAGLQFGTDRLRNDRQRSQAEINRASLRRGIIGEQRSGSTPEMNALAL